MYCKFPRFSIIFFAFQRACTRPGRYAPRHPRVPWPPSGWQNRPSASHEEKAHTECGTQGTLCGPAPRRCHRPQAWRRAAVAKTPGGHLLCRWLGQAESAMCLLATGRAHRLPAPRRGRCPPERLPRLSNARRLAVVHTLAMALEQQVAVTKIRTLYLAGNVRIHLDRVRGLGTFIEFEAVVSRASEVLSARKKLDQLCSHFGIKQANLVSGSYADLLVAARTSMGSPSDHSS